jgi:hypothetical protein
MTPEDSAPRELVDPEARREELLRAGGSVPADAAPRITLSEGTDGATRIDVADTAAVRPGPPHMDLDETTTLDGETDSEE